MCREVCMTMTERDGKWSYMLEWMRHVGGATLMAATLMAAILMLEA